MTSFLQKPLLDPTRRAMLDRARELSRMLEDAWNPAPIQDDVTLLAADLLDAHADTGIGLDSWPRALEVVTNAVLADTRAARLLPTSLRTQAGFTILGTWADSPPSLSPSSPDARPSTPPSAFGSGRSAPPTQPKRRGSPSPERTPAAVGAPDPTAAVRAALHH